MSTQDTQQTIAELTAIRRQIRRWRLAVVVATAVIVTTGLLILKVSAWNLFRPGPKHDRFVSELQHGVVQDVVPEVKGIATQTLDQLVPRVKDEIARVQLRTPEIRAAILTEFDLLNKHLPARAEKVFSGAVDQMLRGREQKIVRMFPGIDAAQIQARMLPLLEESQRRTLKVGNQIALPYANALERIVSDLGTIRETEATTIPDHLAAMDLAAGLVSVLQEELRATASQDPRLALIQTLLVEAK